MKSRHSRSHPRQTRRAFADEPVTERLPVSVPAKLERDAKGNVVRPDWNQAPVPVKSKNFSGLPDWDKPRNEQGEFISKSDAEMRQQWEREGGYAVNGLKILWRYKLLLTNCRRTLR